MSEARATITNHTLTVAGSSRRTFGFMRNGEEYIVVIDRNKVDLCFITRGPNHTVRVALVINGSEHTMLMEDNDATSTIVSELIAFLQEAV